MFFLYGVFIFLNFLLFEKPFAWAEVRAPETILPGSSALNVLHTLFVIKWNWIFFITVHLCGLYTS